MFGYIFDIKRFAVHDGPGIRTTIFLSGCPLKCWWCHNPENWNVSENIKTGQFNYYASSKVKKISVSDAISLVKKDIPFFDESNGGVTISGGEPLQQFDFVKSFIAECKKFNISVTLDTSGYAPTDVIKYIYKDIDLFLFDIKFINDELHQKYTNVSNGLILENLLFLSENNANIKIRIPLIPNITDTDANLNSISKFLINLGSSHRIELLPYNKLSEDKYSRLNLAQNIKGLEVQSNEKMNSIKKLFAKNHVEVKIDG